jgi:hypothetical protein
MKFATYHEAAQRFVADTAKALASAETLAVDLPGPGLSTLKLGNLTNAEAGAGRRKRITTLRPELASAVAELTAASMKHEAIAATVAEIATLD